jgi:hypothetical protein
MNMISELEFDTVLAVSFFLMGIIGITSATWYNYQIPSSVIYFICCMGISLMIARTKHQLK